MTEFSKYNDVIFDAFRLHTKKKEIIERKQDILDKIVEFYNASVSTVLFVGFSPAILSCKHKDVYITAVSDKVLTWLANEGISLKTFDPTNDQKFDLVVAFDEYLTFADSDDEQRAAIASLCKYSDNLIVTTVKDYKNQDFKDREYSQPAIIKTGDQLTAFTEIHDWDPKDKNIWISALYQLSGEQALCRGIYNRRTLFFKQLAKLSMDVGATNFLVHKNLMYKSLIKKNYEHVISISFEK